MTTGNRRNLLKGAAAAGLALGLGHRNAIGAGEENPIIRENANPGSTDWQLTRVRTDTRGGIRASHIEGYCSRQSVAAGQSVDIHVSTKPTQEFNIEVFRTGYYGGRGARLMKTIGPLQGKTQPTPEYGEKRLRECQWDKAVTLKIPSDWPSGVYVGRLTTLSDSTGHGYWQSYIVFIVRDDRPEVIAELKEQMKLVVEMNRIELNNATWDFVGSSLLHLAKAARIGLLAAGAL